MWRCILKGSSAELSVECSLPGATTIWMMTTTIGMTVMLEVVVHAMMAMKERLRMIGTMKMITIKRIVR